jgi:hypothetical protein
MRLKIANVISFVLECLLFVALCLVGLSADGQVISTKPEDTARQYTRAIEFDFVDWTINAIGIKLGQSALDTPYYFSETAQHKIVVDYMHLLDHILQHEYDLNLIYTDPTVSDPVAASAQVRAELNDLYAQQRQLAPVAESVLQSQVSATMADLGLTTGSQPIPPIAFHISPLPYNLIISPRDKIQEDASISLIPDLTVDRQAALEDQVAKALNVSALVVPIGGIGTYPTMVMRSTNLPWLSDTISHEWIHNWLSLRPLGINYMSTPELRTMNETTASIAGSEIAEIVIKRYYPELATEEITQTVSQPAGPVGPGTWPRPQFDFRAEMHKTRVHVDELLAAGKIDEAEAYMEQRRQVFWDNGYAIRKLNQAYFAFYGAYADVPGGAAGEDPVGPAVRALRAQSKTLTDFLETISQMTSFQQLQDALAK